MVRGNVAQIESEKHRLGLRSSIIGTERCHAGMAGGKATTGCLMGARLGSWFARDCITEGNQRSVEKDRKRDLLLKFFH